MTDGPEYDVSFDEEVPIPDAVEQRQAIAPDPQSPIDTSAPVESDPADWQEQVASAGAEEDDDGYDRIER